VFEKNPQYKVSEVSHTQFHRLFDHVHPIPSVAHPPAQATGTHPPTHPPTQYTVTPAHSSTCTHTCTYSPPPLPPSPLHTHDPIYTRTHTGHTCTNTDTHPHPNTLSIGPTTGGLPQACRAGASTAVSSGVARRQWHSSCEPGISCAGACL
jgi:hypothetical protein